MKKPAKKKKKAVKKTRKQKVDSLAVSGSFIDVIKASVKQESKK